MTAQSYISGRTAADISASLEAAIRRGLIAAGDLLPPIRELAAELGVSPGTVASSYRLLNAQGLTSADRRRGTRVRELRVEHASTARQPRTVPAGVADLSTGNPDPLLLPDPTPLLSRVARPPALYGSTVAEAGLVREARRRFAADGVAADHVTVTHGALDAIAKILPANLSPGDRVGIEDPGWASLIGLVEELGYVVVPIAIDTEGPLADSLWQVLAAGTRAAVVTARAHNPTGAAVTSRRAAELRDVLERYPGRLIIEDDHACGLVDSPLCSVSGPTGRYATVRSVAKGYGPDLRLAVVAGDMATVGRLDAATARTSGWVSHFTQRLLSAMWADKDTEADVKQAATTYTERRTAFCERLAEHGIEVTAPSGLNVWVPVGDEATATASLLGEGWLVAPGAMCRIGTPPAIRVTTAGLPIERTAECAAAVARACRSAEGRGRRAAAGA